MIVHDLAWVSHGGVYVSTDRGWRVFFSTYEGAIDTKGRVSIPAAYRQVLGGNTRVFIWVAPDGSGALEGGGEALMQLYAETISELPLQDPVREAIVTTVIAGAADLKIDETGRVRLPEEFCAAAGLTDRIKFTGAIESFKIWAPERHQAHAARQTSLANDPGTLRAFHDAYQKVRRRHQAHGGGREDA